MPGRAPKGWWDKMEKEVKDGNPDYSEDQVKSTIGDIWNNKLSDSKRQEILDRYEKKGVRAVAFLTKASPVPIFEVRAKASGNVVTLTGSRLKILHQAVLEGLPEDVIQATLEEVVEVAKNPSIRQAKRVRAQEAFGVPVDLTSAKEDLGEYLDYLSTVHGSVAQSLIDLKDYVSTLSDKEADQLHDRLMEWDEKVGTDTLEYSLQEHVNTIVAPTARIAKRVTIAEEELEPVLRVGASFPNLLSNDAKKWIQIEVQRIASNFGQPATPEQAQAYIDKAAAEVTKTLADSVSSGVQQVLTENRDEILETLTMGMELVEDQTPPMPAPQPQMPPQADTEAVPMGASLRISAEDGKEKAPEYYYKNDAQELVNTLKGVHIPSDAVEIDMMTYDPNDEVNVAIMWDNSGYTPTASLLATWASPDEALQGAFELLENWTLEYHRKHDDGYLEELQQEWGDEWDSILTEGWDGRVWTLPAREAMTILLSNEYTQDAAEAEMQGRRDLHDMEWEEPEEDEKFASMRIPAQLYTEEDADAEGRILITLENLEEEEGMPWVIVTAPWDKVEDEQSINGNMWEHDGDLAYAIFPDEPRLVDKLEDEGYYVDDSVYYPMD